MSFSIVAPELLDLRFPLRPLLSLSLYFSLPTHTHTRSTHLMVVENVKVQREREGKTWAIESPESAYRFPVGYFLFHVASRFQFRTANQCLQRHW